MCFIPRGDMRITRIPPNLKKVSIKPANPSKTGQQRRDLSASSGYKWKSAIAGAEATGGATYFNQ